MTISRNTAISICCSCDGHCAGISSPLIRISDAWMPSIMRATSGSAPPGSQCVSTANQNTRIRSATKISRYRNSQVSVLRLGKGLPVGSALLVCSELGMLMYRSRLNRAQSTSAGWIWTFSAGVQGNLTIWRQGIVGEPLCQQASRSGHDAPHRNRRAIGVFQANGHASRLAWPSSHTHNLT